MEIVVLQIECEPTGVSVRLEHSLILGHTTILHHHLIHSGLHNYILTSIVSDNSGK
jgi:hypothetical protein